LGAVLTEQGRGADAVPYLEQAASREPGSAMNLALLSVAYAQIGRSQEAVAAASTAGARSAGDEGVQLLAGWAMLVAQRPEDAERLFAEAVRLNPADPEAITK